MDPFDVEFKIDGLDELSFAFFVGDSFEDLDADFIDDVFRDDAGGFLDVVHKKLHALVRFVLLETRGMVEERVCDGRLVDFL